MPIQFFQENISPPRFQRRLLRKALSRLIESYEKEEGDISIVFCTDEYLLQMNQEYLKHDYFTDIITFDYSVENVVAGDLFISIDRVRENAKKFTQPIEHEIRRIVGHGVLHLLGQADKSKAERIEMTRKEEKFLNFFYS